MILISISYNGWSTFLDTFLETVEKKSGFGVNIMPFSLKFLFRGLEKTPVFVNPPISTPCP